MGTVSLKKWCIYPFLSNFEFFTKKKILKKLLLKKLLRYLYNFYLFFFYYIKVVCVPNFSLLLSKLYFLLIKMEKDPKKIQNYTKNTQVDYKKMVIDIDECFSAFVRIFE